MRKTAAGAVLLGTRKQTPATPVYYGEAVSTNAVNTGRNARRVPARVRRWAPWIGGLILIAGVAAAIIQLAPNRNPAPEVTSSAPPQKPVVEKKVPLRADATTVARKFLKTAVARADLAAAWEIVSPNLRAGLTRKEWLTGNIPVVPYPIKSLATARFKIDFSHANDALIEVALLPKAGAKIKGQIFWLGLKRIRGPGGQRRWVVDSWVPRSSTLVPRAAN
jgi:hypothetical protein